MLSEDVFMKVEKHSYAEYDYIILCQNDYSYRSFGWMFFKLIALNRLL